MPKPDRGAAIVEAMRRRARFMAHVVARPETRPVVLERSKADIAGWLADWGWTQDPRNAETGLPTDIPFEPWKKQRDLLAWFLEGQKTSKGGIVEKSRDMGVTWLACAFMVHQWLFVPGWSGGIASRKQELVDRLGDMNAIFPKIRYMIGFIPSWMMPKGWDPSKHDNFMRLLNPETGSTITGETGDQVGRGGRSTIYFLDEFAFMEHAELVSSSVSQTSRCVVKMSTPNGIGNPFYEERHSGRSRVFTFHWRDHPEKDDAWYEKQKADLLPMVVAQEIDIDYAASVDGIVIPGKWVRAAVDRRLALGGRKLAGLDVGDGGAESVYAMIQGPMVVRIEARTEDGTTQTAWWAAGLCREDGVSSLYYDQIGVGAGIYGTFKAAGEDPRITFDWSGVNSGASPTTGRMDDEPRMTNDERFANFRAELWWRARRRFQKTWETAEGIAKHPDNEQISIPNDPKLLAQLSSVKFELSETGKIRIESKAKMRARGIQSPDRAEAVIFADARTEKPKPRMFDRYPKGW